MIALETETELVSGHWDFLAIIVRLLGSKVKRVLNVYTVVQDRIGTTHLHDRFGL